MLMDTFWMGYTPPPDTLLLGMDNGARVTAISDGKPDVYKQLGDAIGLDLAVAQRKALLDVMNRNVLTNTLLASPPLATTDNPIRNLDDALGLVPLPPKPAPEPQPKAPFPARALRYGVAEAPILEWPELKNYPR